MHPQGTQDQGQSMFAGQCERDHREALAPLNSHASSSSSSPVTAVLPLSPTDTQTRRSSGAGCATTDTVLLAGLNERLSALHARREALVRQLVSVDESIEAVAKTVEELQGEQATEIPEWENWDWMNM
jgi:hypothetical protein